MNKIYKLVYSQTLNSLVAVSELATNAQAGKSSKVEISEQDLVASKSGKANLNKLALTFVLSSLFSALPLAASANTGNDVEKVELGTPVTATVNNDVTQATHFNFDSKAGYSATNPGVVADQANGPTVNYVNNVPVVNIVKANAAGVSDNRFKQFSSDTGVYFNNIKNGSEAVNVAALGQKIQANPNLAEAARTIIAQVTGNDKSVIEGTMGVLGQKADLLLINSNGIDLNGVSLVNIKDFTATTGELDRATNNLHVTQGELNVNGALTADDVDTIKLIAAAVKVKAQISAKTANGKKPNIILAGGKQDYNLNTDTATSIAGQSSADKVVISGSALGSMYGNKVNFVVSESGAGINYDGLVIGEDDLQITADGQIKVKNTFSTKDTVITSKSGNIQVGDDSSVKARGSITLTARNVDTTKGTLHAGKAVEVSASELLRVGNVEADKVDLTSSRAVLSAVNTKIKANTLNVNAKLAAKFDGKVTANKELNINLNAPVLASDASDTDVAKAKVAFRSLVKFNDEVTVSGTANIKAAKVEFTGKHATSDTDDTVNNAEFKFASLNLLVNDEGSKAPVSLTNGKLVVNDFGLEVFAPDSISAKPLITANKGRLSVYQTATLNLKNGNKLASINSDDAFQNILDTFNTLHATYGKVKAGDVTVSKNLEYDRGLAFDVNNFTNKGIISTGNSFSVVASNNIDNSGLLFVNGNLLLNAGNHLDLSGKVYTYANLDMKAPRIDQSGQVHVGRNLNVAADAWKLTSSFSGSPTITLGESIDGDSWHHHAVRKDLYKLKYATGTISTDNMKFDIAETNVRGDIKVSKYNSADTSVDVNNSRLTLENGRIVAGGKIDVDGSVTVKTTTFKVPIKALLQTAYPITLDYQAWSLINTKLSRNGQQTFNSLYDFLVKLETDSFSHHQGAYHIQREQVLNVFKQATANDGVLSQIFSSIFGANWRDLNVSDFANKFREFQNYPEKYNIAVFAPDSEVMSLGAFTQSNGKLFVGSDLTGKTINTVNRKVEGLATFIKVKGSSDVLLAQKMSSAKTFDLYLNNMGNMIVHENGQYHLAHDVKWENFADVRAAAPESLRDHLIADNGVLSMLLAEQYKDRVGGYLIAGKATGDVAKEILATDAAYNRAFNSMVVNDKDNSATIEINGVKKSFETISDAVQYLKKNFDHINWIEGEEGRYVPELIVAHKTVLKSTNFDEVAASLSSAKSITTVNNSGVDVNYGSLNTRVLNLDSNGDIKLTGLNGQNVINADETHITTKGNVLSIGNMRAGDLTISAVGDVDLYALSFYTDKGDLANQGRITADEVSINAENVKLDAIDVVSKGDIAVVAKKDINITSEHDEASRFNSIADKNEASGRQISQSAQFVHGTTLEGENIHVEAGKALNIESSKIKATEKGTLKGATVTTTAKADVKHVHAVEEKNQFVMSAKAQFGSSSAGIASQLLDNRDVAGDLETKTASWATTDDTISKAGSGTASSGAQFHKQKTTYETVTVTHVNSELNAKDLTIEATGNAELGNTNINTDGVSVTLGDMQKTATIKASSVTQNNAKDISIVKTQKTEWSLGANSYVSSSVADMASHVVSVARAKKQGKEVDATFAVTVVGDAIGLATRDLASIGSKTSLGYSEKETETHTVADSRNTMAGTINIETTGDTQLKAVDAKLKDLNVKAKNFTLEGGTSETHEKDKSTSFTASIDGSLGVGISGISGSLSISAGFSKNHGSSESLVHQNSDLQVDNANIQVEDSVTLKSANIDASNEVNVDAKTVNVISEADRYASESTGISGTASVGTSMVGAVVPFGSAGVSYEDHAAEKHQVTHQSGISADKVHVKAVAVNLVAGKLDAKTSGKLDAETITSKDIAESSEADGRRIGITLGFNAKGSTIANINGGKDEQEHYAATLHSSLSKNIAVSTPEDKITGNTIVRDTDNTKVREVIQDIKVQGNSFDITVSPTALADLSKLATKTSKKIAAAVENAKGAIQGYLNGYQEVVAETLNTYDSSQSAISSVSSASKFNTGTSGTRNPYNGYYNTGSTSGFNGDFSGGYSGVYGDSVSLNSNAVNREGPTTDIHSSAVEVTRFDPDRDLSGTKSKVKSNLKNESDQAVRDVKFTDLLASANEVNDPKHVNIDSIKIDGTDVGFESQGSTSDFNFGPTPSLDTGSDTGVGKVIGDISHDLDLTTGGTSSIINPSISGGQTGGTGVGTGTGSTLAGSSLNTGTNTGSSSVDTGSSHVDSGLTSATSLGGHTTGTTVDTTGSVIDYNHAGSDFDLDFGGSGDSVTTPSIHTVGGTSSATQLDTGNVTPDQVVSGRTVVTDAGTSGIVSSVNDKQSTGGKASTVSPSHTTDTVTEVSESRGSTSHSDKTATTEISSSSGSSSILAGADSTSTDSTPVSVVSSDSSEATTTDGVSSTSTTSKVVNKGTQGERTANQDKELSQENHHATPADGNAVNGQDIQVGDNAKVTKYQIGNLSCYVMSATQAGAAHVAQAIREGSAALSQVKDGKGFEKFLRQTIRPRATLFSTYSKGIEDALGQSGVICVPTQSEVLKTDYNVVQARNDIPIIKSLSNNDDLEAVVVTERHIRKVRVLANNNSATRKVVYEPTNIQVNEVQEIKQTLSSKGIDSNKIMILGVKSGATSSVAEIIKNSVGNSAVSFDSTSLKTN